MHFNVYDKFSIETLTPKFKAQIILLDQDLIDQSWSHKTWHETWEEMGHFLLQVAHRDEIVMGFSLWTLPPMDNVMHLLKVVVSQEMRRQGIAEKLFFEMLQENPTKGIYLEVQVQNSQAVAFYQKLGLKIMTKTRNYYGAGQDAYKMFKAALPNE